MFGKGVQEYLGKTRTTRAMNEALLDTIPEGERGSFWWWAKLCRQYTGQHFLDSGSAYGYHFTRPVADEKADFVTARFRDGKLEGAYMHLPGYLHALMEAEDETATALQEMLEWFAEWLMSGQSWGDVVSAFGHALEDIGLCVAEKNVRMARTLDGMEIESLGSYLYQRWKHGSKWDILEKKIGLADLVMAKLGEIHSTDLTRHQRSLSNDEYVTEAVAEFPKKAFMTCREAHLKHSCDRGFYSYNHDNDLDQDFQVDLVLMDYGGDYYAILRTHNGCDARGGFSSPVIALLRDYDYLHQWQCDFYCRQCGEGWYSDYDYSNVCSESWPPELPLEDWRTAMKDLDLVAQGQVAMSGLEPKWPWPEVDIDLAKKILEYVDGQDDDDLKLPMAIFVDTEDKIDKFPDPDGNSAAPSWSARLWCPNCQGLSYTVGVSGVANGF